VADQQQARAAQQAAKQAGQGAGARGALRGAAAGALIGEIANDEASQSAAWGAAAEAIPGRRMDDQATTQAKQLENFKKTISVGLEAKNCMVKWAATR
jgi:hypothetical protein